MSIPLMRGRDFNEADGSSSVPVAIVSEAAARSLWPGEDPLGKRLAFHESEPRSFEVVGVVKDIRAAPLSRTQFPYVYVLFGQRYSSRMVLVVRCTGNPSAFADRMKDLVYQIDENVAAVETKTLAENVGFIPYLLRIAAAFLAVCGVFGLLLATVGLYGVVSYSVAQRTREIGIRTALGAQRMDVIKMVISEGFKVTLIATILGLLAGMAAKRYIQTFSLGRVTLDPFVFVTVPVILGAVVLLACYIPARRAARTDPMSALREL
jgi:ABC-type antimicrobial peptide transport system permease subunit